jgi:O-antigen ligase
MRSFTFYCALVLVFLRFSYLPETIAYFTGINTYLLYIFGPIALMGVVAFGGLNRTFRYAPARFWLAFLVYMVLAIPFSSWRGDSVMLAQTYIRTNFLMLLVTAGVAMTWVECRNMMYVIASATILNLVTTHLLMSQTTESDRLVLQSQGSITDPNDLAAHLLLVLPFLLFIVLRRGTPVVIQLILAATLADGLFLILRSGSRGGLVALIVTLGFILVFGSARQRLAVGVAAVVMCIILIAFLPGATWKRITSFSEGPGAESKESRIYLLRKSIEFTFKKPIFGVGPGQFANYEGREAVNEGRFGHWHATHNTYTQISSECGIPALVFFLGAIISTFGILRMIRKKARNVYKPEIVAAVFCITIALIGFSTASMFLSNAYRFDFLAISGLVIAIWQSVSKHRPGPRLDNTLTEQHPEGAELNH